MMLSKKELRRFAKQIVKGLKNGELDPAFLSDLLRSADLYKKIEPFLSKKNKEMLLTLTRDNCGVVEIDQYQARNHLSEEGKASLALVKQQFSLLDITIAKAKELVGSVAVEFGVHYSELYDLICVEKIEALLRWADRGSLLLEDIKEYMTEVHLFITQTQLFLMLSCLYIGLLFSNHFNLINLIRDYGASTLNEQMHQ